MTNVANSIEENKLPKGVSWITAAQAEKRLALSDEAVRLRCVEKWEAAGLAKLEAPPEGGKPRWLIRTDADPALGTIVFPQNMPFDWGALKDDQRAQVAETKKRYEHWRAVLRAAWSVKEARKRYEASTPASEQLRLGVLNRLHKRYRKMGVRGFCDERWFHQTKEPGRDPMLEEARELFLSPNQPSKTQCFEFALQKAKELGWRMWGMRKVTRYLERLEPAVVLYRREGPSAFNDKSDSFIERDYSTLASNELWNADHHEMDVFVKVGEKIDTATGEVKPIYKRPWLTAWQDCRSRKIVGYALYDGNPNTDCIILAFSRAVRAHGIPESVAVDNGKDFDSFALHGRTKRERRGGKKDVQGRIAGIFGPMGIKAHNVQPYHGQSKPIERFFGTLESRFGKLWDTYCGNKPENRPEGFETRLAAGKAPTLAEFVESFDRWVEGYNGREHGGDSMDGKTPDVVFAENLAVKRTATERELDLMLQKPSKPNKVGRNGVTWNGLRYGKNSQALRPWRGKEVTLRLDPADATHVTVWDMEGTFICVAQSNQRLPANAGADLVRAAIVEKAADRKARLNFVQRRLRIHDSLPDRMARLQRGRQAIQSPPVELPPTALRPMRSPVLDQLPKVEKALAQIPLRKSIDAERMAALADLEKLDEMTPRKVRTPQMTPFERMEKEDWYGTSATGT